MTQEQDSFTVFENPVDSSRIAVQDITSEKVINMLDVQESLQALWNLVHPEYIAFVLVSYYIMVTRVQFIKTNSAGRRNTIMLLLTILWGVVEFFWRGGALLSLLVTALFVNASWEYLFKWLFRVLEKFGWTPLPAWHVEEIKVEKQNDIDRAEKQMKKPDNP